ncbi:M3 family oligoendopeptidase [Sporolactobacillus spathodeae]|uniref:M3 family oligoendopeptidase n=1 Tax=Sporolactobacillus spathodeae TaxID=1465502 RepID=A0ABS2Q5J2_9BACL|nr:M3 family oligoendopeptidase [Sporolactobacillus spathodeae]MBM7656700.1 M3 family oligoendopeptidase [Sporolactobacillus spathodeae]
MTVFEDFQYTRPEVAAYEKKFENAFDAFRSAKSFEAAEAAFLQVNELRKHLDTLFNLVEIRHTINTEDPFYKEENDYMDETMPLFEGKTTAFYQLLMQSPYQAQLEKKWGKQLFSLANAQLKSFSDDVIPLMQEENKWASKYTKLIAAAKIAFDGEERTLAQLMADRESEDREVRKAATAAYFGYFADHEEEFDTIYDHLVKIRTEIAHKLGFANYTEMSYYRMARIGYDKEMVKNYREQIRRYVVPVANKLYERQRARLGVEKFYFYDEPYYFKTGNAKPKGDADWILKHGKKMYHELSPETGEFFDYMIDHHLMDLLATKGKAGGGYCTYIFDYQSPFIFSNFNGTAGDIDVLTHEAGHAFQVYSTKNNLIDYRWPTYEGAEIHSMSMEFFTWPWMNLFFKEETEKRKFAHLSEALLFLPYGVSVDEFQHVVYEHPEMTPAERKQAWKEIEQKYLPHRDYDGMNYLERGGVWQRQGHIYESPFYYIDYTLAQVCAFEFWKKSQEDFASAWKDYLHLCKQGGSQSFLDLVQTAKLESPFKEGCVSTVIDAVSSWLNQVDDSQF